VLPLVLQAQRGAAAAAHTLQPGAAQLAPAAHTDEGNSARGHLTVSLHAAAAAAEQYSSAKQRSMPVRDCMCKDWSGTLGAAHNDI